MKIQMSKSEKVIFGLLVAVLAFNLSSGMRMARIEDSLDNINLKMRYLQENAGEISREVGSSLRSFKKEHSWIADSSVEVTDYNWEDKTAIVRANWTFNELEKGSKVYFLYGEKDEISGQVESWQQVEAANIGALNYAVEMELPYMANYGLQIMAQAREVQKSHVLRDIDIEKDIENRIDIDGYVSSISASGKGKVRVRVDNYFGDVEELKIESAFAYVYFKDNLIYKIDVMKEADRFSGEEIEDKGFEEYDLRKEMDFDKLIKDFKEYEFHEISDNIEVEVVVKDGLGIEYKGSKKN